MSHSMTPLVYVCCPLLHDHICSQLQDGMLYCTASSTAVFCCKVAYAVHCSAGFCSIHPCMALQVHHPSYSDQCPQHYPPHPPDHQGHQLHPALSAAVALAEVRCGPRQGDPSSVDGSGQHNILSRTPLEQACHRAQHTIPYRSGVDTIRRLRTSKIQHNVCQKRTLGPTSSQLLGWLQER